MKKRVAIFINTAWNIYNFRVGLIKALQKEGYEVIAISPYDEYTKKLEGIGCKHYHIKINNKGSNPLEDLKLIYDIYKLYKKISPDVVLQYTIKPNIYGSIASYFAKVPVISNISGLGTVFLNNSLSSKIARKLYKIALKIPKKVFFQNPYDRKLFFKLKLVDRKKAELIPGSGIDIKKFKPYQKSDCSNSLVKFLFIARLVKDKGLLEYIDAAKILKQKYKDIVEFAIIGAFYPNNPTAITKEQMDEWVDSGIVNYLGVSDNIKEVIAKYDCIVLPSYREGLSRVLLEAASMAKPIVTTNVPGCKDVVDDGVNGFLCKVKSATSLANSIEKVINLSKEDRDIMGYKSREKIIKEFDEKIVIGKYLEVIKKII